ncbi:MAG: prepilin-type N-terminal cleavage/methylation domain-containing protein [Nitrospirae bacterium]|nr:prepilin-type N-terminal cleavage/methylation domain-containing protein [Nitrospirota bacterium]MBF0535418.1 prepilin-type N-terminal cleavage/methylation domain-containing protein [Nitrospirota bacterium]
MLTKKIGKKGFTLVEMMVVVAIIGILAAIGIPQFLKFVAEAKTTEAIEYSGRLAQAMNAFKDIHQVYPTGTGNGGQLKSDDIGSYLPQLDLGNSKNFSYTATVNKTGDNFCIEAQSLIAGDFSGYCVYYVYDVSGISSKSMMDDEHFFRKEFTSKGTIHLSAVGSTPCTTGTCKQN